MGELRLGEVGSREGVRRVARRERRSHVLRLKVAFLQDQGAQKRASKSAVSQRLKIRQHASRSTPGRKIPALRYDTHQLRFGEVDSREGVRRVAYRNQRPYVLLFEVALLQDQCAHKKKYRRRHLGM